MPAHLDLLISLGRSTDASARETVLAQLSQLTSTLIEKTGRGLLLTEEDLAGLDLSGVDLRWATLNRANLHSTRLVGADLREITMVCPGMERTDFSNANLTHAYVHALAAQTCVFDGADLTGLRDATGTLFHGCSMKGTILSESHLAGSTFYQCDLTDAEPRGVNLQGSLIKESLLVGAELSGASVDQFTILMSEMSGANLTGASEQGLTISRPTGTDGLILAGARLPHLRLDTVRGRNWNAVGLAAPDADLIDVALVQVDLSRADLSRSMWRSVSMPGATMNQITLTDSKITRSSLAGSPLPGTHAENVSIVESDLSECDLSGAAARCLTPRDVNLGGADLSHASLCRAMLTGDPPKGMSLRGARLSNAVLVQSYIAADLTEADLTGVNGAYSRSSQSCLDRARLDGASTHQSTWVKASFVGVSLANVVAPIFVGRCRGLLDAVRATGGDSAGAMEAFLESFASLLATARKGST